MIYVIWIKACVSPTFLAAIIALMISNYHQISSSSLTTGKLPVFAIAVA